VGRAPAAHRARPAHVRTALGYEDLNVRDELRHDPTPPPLSGAGSCAIGPRDLVHNGKSQSGAFRPSSHERLDFRHPRGQPSSRRLNGLRAVEIDVSGKFARPARSLLRDASGGIAIKIGGTTSPNLRPSRQGAGHQLSTNCGGSASATWMVRGALGSNGLVPTSNPCSLRLELGTSRACGQSLGRPIRPPNK
jgi:hypothetical protein